jgi:hypothetical protein
MTDNKITNIGDQELDHLLADVFPTAPALSDQFEDQVMFEVDTINRARSHHRRIARLMVAYWGVATTIMSVLFANSSLPTQPVGAAVVSVILITVLSGIGLAWFITRQSGMKLQSLFAQTLL